MKSTIRSVASYARITISILLMVLLPLVVFTMLTSKTDKIFGIQSMVVLTGSMSPSIPQGSLIFSQKQDTYRPGQVISYKTDGVTVTHRIIETVEQNGAVLYRTQGDANNSADLTLVPSHQILGKVQYGLMHIGNFILFLRTPAGFLAFIIAPLILFVMMELLTIKREIEKETERRIIERMRLRAI